jgi:hypothetical protein
VTADNAVIALISVATVAVLIVWFDKRCLDDLSQTSDMDLRYFTRNAWALLIVFTFPIGPMLYLRYGKGPGRTL